MSESIFEKSIELLIKCGQQNAYLHNFGEPLLHPKLSSFIKYATERGVECNFFTNGILLNPSILSKLIEAGLKRICISEHSTDEYKRVSQIIQEYSFPIFISSFFNPIESGTHTWANQVLKIHNGNNINPLPCIFERQNAFVILWDGKISVCCIDVDGISNIGTVDDYLLESKNYKFQQISICSECNLMRGEESLM